MIPVYCIENLVITIEDSDISYPCGWLFLTARNYWAGGFVARIAQENKFTSKFSK